MKRKLMLALIVAHCWQASAHWTKSYNAHFESVKVVIREFCAAASIASRSSYLYVHAKAKNKIEALMLADLGNIHWETGYYKNRYGDLVMEFDQNYGCEDVEKEKKLESRCDDELRHNWEFESVKFRERLAIVARGDKKKPCKQVMTETLHSLD